VVIGVERVEFPAFFAAVVSIWAAEPVVSRARSFAAVVRDLAGS